MASVSIRQILHAYVEDGDDRFLKMVYAFAKEYHQEYEQDFSFSQEDIEKFDNRREKRLRGESKTFSPEEVRAIITGKIPGNAL